MYIYIFIYEEKIDVYYTYIDKSRVTRNKTREREREREKERELKSNEKVTCHQTWRMPPFVVNVYVCASLYECVFLLKCVRACVFLFVLRVFSLYVHLFLIVRVCVFVCACVCLCVCVCV